MPKCEGKKSIAKTIDLSPYPLINLNLIYLVYLYDQRIENNYVLDGLKLLTLQLLVVNVCIPFLKKIDSEFAYFCESTCIFTLKKKKKV